jgi:hypothetical protein
MNTLRAGVARVLGFVPPLRRAMGKRTVRTLFKDLETLPPVRKYELLKRRLNATRTPSSFEKSLREDSEADFVLRTLTFTTGERPYYAFGSYLACMQAKALGHSAVSLFEWRGQAFTRFERTRHQHVLARAV